MQIDTAMKKYIFTLLIVFSVSYLFAQTASTDSVLYRSTTIQVSVGDTVSIDSAYTTYATGERMSSWVYNVNHIVRQVNSKYHPGCVLLRGINSWVVPKALIPNGLTYDRVMAEQQAVKAAAEAQQRAIREAKEREEAAERERLEAEQRAEAERQAELERQAEAERLAQQQAEQVEPSKEPEVKQQEVPDARHRNFSRLSLGLRGGAASIMQQTNIDSKWNCGFDAAFDFQYTYYFGTRGSKKALHKPTCGILTGVSLAYTRNGVSAGVDTTYSVAPEGVNIDYTIQTDRVKENDGQLQIEVPLMFSLLTEKGFFFNVGPKFILPVYTNYDQNMNDPTIDAYFQTMDVHVTNDPVTGKVTNDQLDSKGRWKAGTLSVSVGVEVGKEWTLKNENSIGLGVYGNYGVYSLYKNNADANKSLINVSEPTSVGNATVDVVSMTDTYGNKLGFFDAGVKLVYHFNFTK